MSELQDVLLSATVTMQVSQRVETDDPAEALRDYLAHLRVKYGREIVIEHPQAKDFLSRRSLAFQQATGVEKGKIIRPSRR